MLYVQLKKVVIESITRPAKVVIMLPELLKKSPLFYKRKLRSKRVKDQNWQLENFENDTFIECIDKPEVNNGTTPKLTVASVYNSPELDYGLYNNGVTLKLNCCFVGNSAELACFVLYRLFFKD